MRSLIISAADPDPDQPIPYQLTAKALAELARPGCMYCGNTGTVNGARCQVCNGG